MNVIDIVVWGVFIFFFFSLVAFLAWPAAMQSDFGASESSRYRKYFAIRTDCGVQVNFGAAQSSAQFHEYGMIPRDANQRKGNDYWPGESTYSSVMKRVRIVEELIVYQEYGMGWFRLRS